jgi:hypothetical protein
MERAGRMGVLLRRVPCFVGVPWWRRRESNPVRGLRNLYTFCDLPTFCTKSSPRECAPDRYNPPQSWSIGGTSDRASVGMLTK